jgi:AraC-like DNA-binding protein
MSAEAPSELIERETTAYRETVPAPDSDWPPDVRIVYKKLRRQLFDEELVIQDTLDDCRLGNQDTYSRFGIETGHEGIKAFVVHHRVQLAKRLLRRTSLSVTQIAFAVGCASSSGFCTTFKRREGCTPTAFREREED